MLSAPARTVASPRCRDALEGRWRGGGEGRGRSCNWALCNRAEGLRCSAGREEGEEEGEGRHTQGRASLERGGAQEGLGPYASALRSTSRTIPYETSTNDLTATIRPLQN